MRILREFLFADDAAITTHTVEGLQQQFNRFAAACSTFGPTISLKKTQVMGQDVNELPCINIADYVMEAIHEFVYLGSTISDTLSLDAKLNRLIGTTAATLARLIKRVWENAKLTVLTKAQAYMACVMSTLLYGSIPFTCNLQRILDITWKDHVTNNTVLERTGVHSMFTLLKQRRMQ
ncbi:uncharacterized protein [Procambarus clarkii]|uniref:uncharacterized protein n=1 Tax=Procambarus clarkii TaxID=6728 RepID=UPI003743E91D